MNKILFLLLGAMPLVSHAALKQFQPQDSIKASEINSNFSYIRSLFQSRNIPLDFKMFQPGSIINSSELESEFNTVRSLSIPVSPIGNSLIKADVLNNAFSQMESGIDVWPLGSDGDLTLSSGSYQLETSGNNLRVVNTDNSSIVKSNIGSFSDLGETAGTCKADLNNLTISSGALLKISSNCKWLILGVRGNSLVNGEIRANYLTTGGTWTTRTPEAGGQLIGNLLTSTITQKNGASGASGTASSSSNSFGLGGVQSCGFGGGGGGGAGINNFIKQTFPFTSSFQTYTVPPRVNSVKFKIWGGGGAGDNYTTYNNGQGGAGGAVVGTMGVTPGENFNIVVGGGGSVNNTNQAFGSGGLGQIDSLLGYRSNPGGLSGVFKGAGAYSQASTIAIAGSGGSASSRDGWSGGAGGNPAQTSNEYNRGHGAISSGPGRNDGMTGSGARGACGSSTSFMGGIGGGGHNGGGGGGSGYFGGGGGNGGTGVAGGGGGGGLSFINPAYATGSYLNGSWRTPGNTNDPHYPLTNNAGFGGISGGGNPGYVIMLVEGDSGFKGADATCGAPGTGGLGSVNNGGTGGLGGNPGLHGQSLYFKIIGNLSGSGKITVSGTNGSSGTTGSLGGTIGADVFGNGGSGGGGAGGSAGKIIIRRKGSFSGVTLDVSGGQAGSGGVGGQSGDNGVIDNQSI